MNPNFHVGNIMWLLKEVQLKNENVEITHSFLNAENPKIRIEHKDFVYVIIKGVDHTLYIEEGLNDSDSDLSFYWKKVQEWCLVYLSNRLNKEEL